MIDSLFARTADAKDAGLDIATVLWRDASPQPGPDRQDGIAEIRSATVADSLKQMGFEYPVTSSALQPFAITEEISAALVYTFDFSLGIGAPATRGQLPPTAGGVAPALAWFESPAVVAPLFDFTQNH